MRVLITGANSYIGNSIKSYIETIDMGSRVDQLDVTDDKWLDYDFYGYDAVVHVAAIVHRKDVDSWELYEKVNVELTETVARKARAQGVGQFVFLSTMAVYGAEKTLSVKKSVISAEAAPAPTSLYGKSKYMAEQRLARLECQGFRVAVVRPPNVYGPGCRGGYISTYARIVSKLPAIPRAFSAVKQSVIYIDNLCRFIYLLIAGQKSGIYTPQDNAGVSAVELMEAVSDGLGLKRRSSSVLGLFVYLLAFCPLVTKGYGGIAYDHDDSHQNEFDYRIVTFREGIKRTVQYGTKCDNPGI